MKAKTKLLNLRHSGRITLNVSCGLVMVMPHRQVAGCGAKPTDSGYTEFFYDLEGYEGKLWSTVSLCPKCATKELRKAKPRAMTDAQLKRIAQDLASV